MLRVFAITLFTISSWMLHSQGVVYTPKAGLSFGVQNWSGISRQPLLSWHGAIALEGYKENSTTSFGIQLGYHSRGSSERIRFVTGDDQRQQFVFKNIGLTFIAKKKLSDHIKRVPYVAFGPRLEYTIGTNLDEGNVYASYYPQQVFVNKFNYGATLSFGYEFAFSELIGGIVEVSISPDLSNQYEQPAGLVAFDPFQQRNITLPQQRIRNLSVELSFGLRLINKVVYLNR